MTSEHAPNVVRHTGSVTASDRAAISGGRGLTVWLTGLSGSGKSTVAHLVERRLVAQGRLSYVLDGDNLRTGLNADLGFSAADRKENVRRIGAVARLMNDAGFVVLVPVISPFAAGRLAIRQSHAEMAADFAEIFVDTSLEVCEQRDTKGLYAKARAGEIRDFTGIGSPYEAPVDPELRIDTSTMTEGEAADVVFDLIWTRSAV